MSIGIPLIAVHVGAGYHSRDKRKCYKNVCREACLQAIKVLREGGSAVDGVCMATEVLENAACTNAGFGSNLTEKGTVECEAGLMDGRTLQWTAAGALTGVTHPINVARQLLSQLLSGPLSLGRQPPRVLIGPEAVSWAKRCGIPCVSDQELVSYEARKTYKKHRRMVEQAELDRRKKRKLDHQSVGCDSANGSSVGDDDPAVNSFRYKIATDYVSSSEMHRKNINTPIQVPSLAIPPDVKHMKVMDGRTMEKTQLTCTKENKMRNKTASPNQENKIDCASESSCNGSLYVSESICTISHCLDGPADTTNNQKLFKLQTDLNEGFSVQDICDNIVNRNMSSRPMSVLKTAHCVTEVSSNHKESFCSKNCILEDRLDTVGAVCVDENGFTASAVSSGGIAFKQPGRIGQACQFGCGCWAKGKIVAVTTSGCGEQLIATMLARECAAGIESHQISTLGLEESLRNSFTESPFLSGSETRMAGVLAVKLSDTVIDVMWGHTTPSMCVGYMSASLQTPVTRVSSLPPTGVVGKTVIVEGAAFPFNQQ